MKKLNVILVYNKEGNHILMCKRRKPPYLGKYNLVGGKLEENETDYEAAYRELREETNIQEKDIDLKKIMVFYYCMSDVELQVFTGKLDEDIQLIEEVNPLIWISHKDNFFDLEKYAGEGNIGHMVEQTKLYWDNLY